MVGMPASTQDQAPANHSQLQPVAPTLGAFTQALCVAAIRHGLALIGSPHCVYSHQAVRTRRLHPAQCGSYVDSLHGLATRKATK